ncbi:MAG: hypothetical protein OXH31_02160 [Gammaproteobacteria bacterium]|nr:hypothetical protein [Gammaproteobacteria bacterium]
MKVLTRKVREELSITQMLIYAIQLDKPTPPSSMQIQDFGDIGPTFTL